MSAPRYRPPRESAWQRVWQPFWVLPVVLTVASGVLAVALPALDRSLSASVPWLFQGGPDGARSLLSTIASAMISVTGLVFSITMVVLQLASSQFTPRVLGSFLDSRVTQSTLGVFTGTFVYALTVLRSVRGESDELQAFVPQTSVTAAFLFVLASVGFFLAFIQHITNSIRVSQVVLGTADEARDVVGRLYPQEPPDEPADDGPPRPAARTVTVGDRSGHLREVDLDGLLRIAAEHDVLIEVVRQMGEFLPEGGRVAVVRAGSHAALTDELVEDVGKAVVLARERGVGQDPAFGLRKLVDIAERALSPAVNDPTTASQVVDAEHRALRLAVQRYDPPARLVDDEGRLRVVHRPQTVADLLQLAVREIAHWGRDSLQIPVRLRAMLDDLDEVALPRHRPALAAVRREIPPDHPEESPRDR
ncbi:hypothetical protein N866_07365 [Actinotalea ferrariae CF5-4]|uniref:DUF2254 domain-containing protein n=1 Tax=Actinotalea ferrariae CF5-4 TaxID=948458 RepID=A0A021VU23_9CELL|nr:DUF2254 domain-containing protein [Actinotalea ferrariae]EYR62572.1 hypothetical protein N866_07365 [Actinotalea ferrariae CF5-4]